MAISGKRQEMDSELTCSHSIKYPVLYNIIYLASRCKERHLTFSPARGLNAEDLQIISRHYTLTNTMAACIFCKIIKGTYIKAALLIRSC